MSNEETKPAESARQDPGMPAQIIDQAKGQIAERKTFDAERKRMSDQIQALTDRLVTRTTQYRMCHAVVKSAADGADAGTVQHMAKAALANCEAAEEALPKEGKA